MSGERDFCRTGGKKVWSFKWKHFKMERKRTWNKKGSESSQLFGNSNRRSSGVGAGGGEVIEEEHPQQRYKLLCNRCCKRSNHYSNKTFISSIIRLDAIVTAKGM